MLFKIVMYATKNHKYMEEGHRVDMPSDVNLTLSEAIYRAELYTKKNPVMYYSVQEMDKKQKVYREHH